MIKFNEVTWYSKLLAVILFIALLPILTFYIGTEYQQAVDINNNIPSVSESSSVKTNVAVSGSTGSSMSTGVYTNATYGWSFHYPTNWKVAETANGGVTVSANIAVATSAVNVKQPAILAITITSVKKTAFAPLKTKVGNIGYDAALGALVDSSGQSQRCLPYTPFLGRNNVIKGFLYGGSNMSDPAYLNYAILTNKDYMVLMQTEDYGETNNEKLRLEAEAGQQKIFDSFKLTAGTDAIVPACSQ